MLIPSELRNLFPSNSLNRSASSSCSSSFLLLLLLLPRLPRLLVFFVSPSPAIYLTLPASVFKDLITDSSLILSSFPVFFRLSARLILCVFLSPSIFGVFFLPSSSSWPHLPSAQGGEDGGMRSSPFHGRETRLRRRKGGVKEESSREDEAEMEERRRRRRQRRWITREVERHADDKEADTMTGLFSVRFEYIGSLWRGHELVIEEVEISPTSPSSTLEERPRPLPLCLLPFRPFSVALLFSKRST